MRIRQYCLIALFGLIAIVSGGFMPAQAAEDRESSPTAPFTNVSGLITQDTTWSTAGSPYVVVQSIRVQEDVTLRIEPGVEVRFAGNYFLEIDGTLIALGTEGAPIVFTSGDGSPSPGDWGVRPATHLAGISFRNTAVNAVLDEAGNYVSGSVLRHSRIEYGTGISINGTAPLIEHNLIRYNRPSGGAAVFYNGYGTGTVVPQAYIRHNWITDNQGLGLNLQQGNVDFADNLVTRNIGAYWGSIDGSIQRNTFACNAVGSNNSPSEPGSFILSALANPAAIRNNNFFDNGAIDVRLRFDGQNLDLSNNYWGTTDLSAIQERIFDQTDYLEIPGLVTIEPYLTQSVPASYFDPLCQLEGNIVSLRDGDWSDPSTWNLGRIPTASDTVIVQQTHTVTVFPAVEISALLNFGVLRSQIGKPLEILATGLISNSGQILGSDGHTGQGTACGGAGSSIELRGTPIENAGIIRAGKGGDGMSCGGPGGNLLILGRDTTNTGEILGGDGGNVLGTLAGFGGEGGETHIWGKWGGAGFLVNQGLARGGNGGNGNEAASEKQRGGDGGRLKLISFPDVYLDGGRQYGGAGGRGTGGGVNGGMGDVVIEPSVISLAGAGTEVRGGDIVIFGGDDMTLDLSDMQANAISATGNITLAVGAGSSIDLSGNVQPILQAAGRVVVASNSISLSAGIDLDDLVAGGVVEIKPATVLADVSLIVRGAEIGTRAVPMSLTLTVLNGAPITDTIQLTSDLPADWLLEGLPASITLPGIDVADITVRLTPPASATPGARLNLAVTATSHNDTSVGRTETIEIDLATATYLPMVTR